MKATLEQALLDVPQIADGAERWAARGEIAKVRKLKGWRLGTMAAYQEGERWVVFHVPSGYMIFPSGRSFEDAQSLMETMGAVLPLEGELGVSPALRMTPVEQYTARNAFTTWLATHGYGGTVGRMAGAELEAS